MDYHSMKRKELQALCKKHNIPANSSNLDMADKLSQLLNDKQKPTTRQQRTCLKNSSETIDETGVTTRQTKKVRFSPKNELYEYELRSSQKGKAKVADIKPRRKSMTKKIDNGVVDDDDIGESSNKDGEFPSKVTRSSVHTSGPIIAKKRGKSVKKDVDMEKEAVKEIEVSPIRITRLKVQTLGKGAVPVNGKKQGRRAAKDVKKESEAVKETEVTPVRVTRFKVQKLGKVVSSVNGKKQGRRAAKDVKKESEAVKETEVTPVRVTRFKVQKLGKGVSSVNEKKQGRRAAKDIEREGEAVKEIEVIPGRVTRSKVQTSMEDDVDTVLESPVKKRSGRGMAKHVEDVEPSKGIVDRPIRLTRARAQTSKTSTSNTNPDPPAEKKRARRELKVVDNINKSVAISSNATSKDHQEVPKRKSLRNREVEIDDENGSGNLKLRGRKKRRKESINEVFEIEKGADKGLRRPRRNEADVKDSTALDKNICNVEVGSEVKVTRSGTRLAVNSSEGKNKRRSKTEVEGQRESYMLVQESEFAGIKNVNNKKSLMPKPEDAKVVLQLEEHANHPARKDTRRKSVVHKAEGQGVDKPAVGKGEMPKEIVELARTPSRRSQRKSILIPNTPTVDILGSRKTVVRKHSKEQSGNLCAINGKATSENETNAAASAATDNRSRKRKGEHIIEEHPFENDYASPVESPRRFTRNASKNVGKAVTNSASSFIAEKQRQSRSKTPLLRMENQPAPDGQRSGNGLALRSGVAEDSRSKKKAKLSMSPHGAKQNGSEKVRSGKLNMDGAKSPLLVKSEETSSRPGSSRAGVRRTGTGVRGTGTDCTPVVKETPRRFTRSAVKTGKSSLATLFEKVSEKKQLSQSAIKGHLVGDDHLSSPEVAEDRSDVNNSKVIKHSSSRKRKKDTDDDLETIPSTTKGVHYATSKEAEVQMLVNPLDVSVSQANDVGEADEISMSGTVIATEKMNSGSGESASGMKLLPVSGRSPVAASAPAKSRSWKPRGKDMEIECASVGKSSRRFTRSAAKCQRIANPNLSANMGSKKQGELVHSPKFEAKIPSGVDKSKRALVSMTDVSETTIDAHLDGSHVRKQNEDVSMEHTILNEAEDHVAVNTAELSESPRPKACEMDMKLTSGTKFARLQIDEGDREEAEVSPGQTVVPTGNVDTDSAKINNIDAASNCDAVLYKTGASAHGHASVEQSSLETTLEMVEAFHELPANESALDTPVVEHDFTDDRVDAEIEMESMQEPSTCEDILQGSSVGKDDVVDNSERDVEDNRVDNQKLVSQPDVDWNTVNTGNNGLQRPDLAHDVAVDVAGDREMVSEQPSTKNDVAWHHAIAEHGVEVGGVSTQTELVSHPEPPTGDDMFQGPAVGEHNSIKDEVNAEEIEPKQHKVSTGQNDSVSESDIAEIIGPEPGAEPSSGNDILRVSAFGEDDVEDESDSDKKGRESEEMPAAENFLLTSAEDKCDGDDAREEVPSTGCDVLEIPVTGEIDVDTNEELETESKTSTSDEAVEIPVLCSYDVEDEGANANDDFESEPKPSTSDDVEEITVLSEDVEDEVANAGEDLESELKPSTGDEVVGLPVLGSDHVGDEGVNEEPESEPKTSTRDEVEEILVFGSSDDEDEGPNSKEELESEPKPATVNDIVESSTCELDVAVGVLNAQEESTLNSNKDSVSENSNHADTEGFVARICNNTVSGTISGSDDIEGSGSARGVMDSRDEAASCEDEQKAVDSAEFDEGVHSKEWENDSHGIRDFALNREGSNSNISQRDGGEEFNANVDMPGSVSVSLNSNIIVDDLLEDGKCNVSPEARRPHSGIESAYEGPGMCNEHRIGDAEMTVKNDYVGYEMEKTSVAATDETLGQDFGGNTCVDVNSKHGIGVATPLDDKNEVRTVTDKMQFTSPSKDLGDNSLDIEEQQKTDPAKENEYQECSGNKDQITSPIKEHIDDVFSKMMEDDSVPGLLQHSAARASSPREGRPSHASELAYSDLIVEKASSRKDEKSIQEDAMGENSSATMKSIDESSDFFNWAEDSSMKALFATPCTTRPSQVRPCQEVAALDSFDHQWVTEPLGVSDFEGAQVSQASGLGLGDDSGKERTPFVPHNVSRNLGEFSGRYFTNEGVDGPDGNPFEDDQVDEIRQDDLLSGVAGTSGHEACDSVEFRDNIAGTKGNLEEVGGQYGDKKETRVKGGLSESDSKLGDNAAFNRGT